MKKLIWGISLIIKSNLLWIFIWVINTLVQPTTGGWGLHEPGPGIPPPPSAWGIIHPLLIIYSSVILIIGIILVLYTWSKYKKSKSV